MGMTQERIKECIKLLETDGINSKAMVLDILKKELASSLLVQETKIEPKELFFSCMIPDVDKLTLEMRKYCLQRIGKKIVEDSSFTHKYAYELGAKLIAMGEAENTIIKINNNTAYERIIKQTEHRLIEARKLELERELRDL